MRKRKSPEVRLVKESPRVIKVERMPMGASVIKINYPFTLRHLSQRGVTRAWILAQTQKSIMTVIGKNVKQIKEIQQKCLDLLYKDHPALPKKGIYAKINYTLNFGHAPTQHSFGSFKYVGNVQALVRDFNDCGFSDIPLIAFMIPLDESVPYTGWVQFSRKAAGFVAVEINNKLYNQYKLSDLKKILSESPTLQKLRAYLCQIHKVTQETYTCKITDEE